jgi:molybdopterin molybdotransferase
MRVFQAKKLDEAISLALAQVEPIVEPEETLSARAYGRILAQEIVCPEDIPGFARSAMDGYAVRAQDICGASLENPVTLKVIGSVEMGQDPRALSRVTEGEAMEVPTGGPIPPGADAVVMLEETERQSPDTVRIFAAGVVGTHVLAADSDFQRGERVFSAGHRLRAVDIGALFAMGVLSVKVYRRVRVGILSTGSELVEAERKTRPGQIRQINSHIVRGLIESEGAHGFADGIVPDDREELKAAVQRAVSKHDLVLLSGGSSVGSRDWTLDVLQQLGEVFIHGLQIKPGKPTIFAVIDKKPVVGLPGNPVSCALVFEKFVRPVLARRSGLTVLLPSHKLASAQLTQTVRSVVGREDFVAVRLRLDSVLYAEPVPGHSNNISTLARADGVLSVPAELEEIPQGAQVWVELL